MTIEREIKVRFVIFSRHHSSNKIHVFNYSSHQSLFSETFVVNSQEVKLLEVFTYRSTCKFPRSSFSCNIRFWD